LNERIQREEEKKMKRIALCITLLGLLAGCGSVSDPVSTAPKDNVLATQDQIAQIQAALVENGVDTNTVEAVVASFNPAETNSAGATRAVTIPGCKADRGPNSGGSTVECFGFIHITIWDTGNVDVHLF